MLKPNILLKIIFSFVFFKAGLLGQDVSVSLGSVEVDGYTSDIIVPININSPNHSVGGIQFDLSITPNLLELFQRHQKMLLVFRQIFQSYQMV